MSELPPGNGGKRGSEGGFIMGILYQAADPLYWVIWLFLSLIHISEPTRP